MLSTRGRRCREALLASVHVVVGDAVPGLERPIGRGDPACPDRHSAVGSDREVTGRISADERFGQSVCIAAQPADPADQPPGVRRTGAPRPRAGGSAARGCCYYAARPSAIRTGTCVLRQGNSQALLEPDVAPAGNRARRRVPSDQRASQSRCRAVGAGRSSKFSESDGGRRRHRSPVRRHRV